MVYCLCVVVSAGVSGLLVACRLCVRRSGPFNAGHPWVHKGEVFEHGLVNTVNEGPVSTRQPGLLIDKLLVEVAAVAG